MITRCVWPLTGTLAVLFVAGGCLSIRDGHDLKGGELEYRLQELKEPRPNRVHVLRADLANGKLQPVVVIADDPDGDGPAEAALMDPLQLAGDPTVLAFVNTNPWSRFPDTNGEQDRSWFEGQPVDINGLAVSGRQVRSSPQQGSFSVWVNERGRVHMEADPPDGAVVEGMAGFQQIVREGTVVVPPGGALHPRTAIGVDRSGIVVWLVVVDGRQEQYSEGMNLYELGCLMLDLGCWNATNMDGGGSSIMGLAGAGGRLRVVNSPSDRSLGAPKIRPLPMILTIRKKSHSKLLPIMDKQSTGR